ncbi:MAG: carbon starvation CstA family protein [Planctomycetia bacterium]|nr:carbon starvation CstA family protein [Planctomycetia bacterium]
MILFFSGLLILILGYFTYGKWIESILRPNDRKTPAIRYHDGVDYLVLPHWKNMLIQLLNIAGVGPVIGVILGIKFGAIAFLIIPIGNIIGGSVHDYVSGIMSMRHKGANLPKMIRMSLGAFYYSLFCCFIIVALLLVVTSFINVPANLIDSFFPQGQYFLLIVSVIFCYYIVATLFPVDKIIGKIYPFFGAMLIIGTLLIFASVIFYLFTKDNQLLVESEAFRQGKLTTPIIPCLFVTIACGILSGFHATQSPIIARTLASERQAYSSFYGMMVVEGFIGMVWAAAGMGIYNLFPELMAENPTFVLTKITDFFLGKQFGFLTILAVIVLAITTGDTALRSLRLSASEVLGISQRKIIYRLAVIIPLVLIICGLLLWSNKSAKTFNGLWNYFSWLNQILASSTLMGVTVWLFRTKKNGWVTLVPGTFITFVILTYILWVSEAHNGPIGFGLPINIAYIISAILTGMIVAQILRCSFKKQKRGYLNNKKNIKQNEDDSAAAHKEIRMNDKYRLP